MMVLGDNYLGKHVLARFEGIPAKCLDSQDLLLDAVYNAVEEAKMTLIKYDYHCFQPQGVTVFAILAESHLAIHAWPELESAAVECFTCGEEGDPVKAVESVCRFLKPKKCSVQCLYR